MADPYVYPGTGVLCNLAGLQDADTLADHEAQASTLRLVQLTAVRLEGAYDLPHLQRLTPHAARPRPAPPATSRARETRATRELSVRVYASAGKTVNAPPCSGVTARKARSSSVRMRRVSQRAASTTSEASARPSSRSR